MKKISIFLCGLLVSLATLYAQTPAPDPDTLRDVKQTDPEVEHLPSDINYRDGQIKITPAQLPAEVKQTLQSGSEYEGWEKAAVYKSKNNGRYTVEITKADTARIFRFDKLGRPVKE
jgi:hypothetical protein